MIISTKCRLSLLLVNIGVVFSVNIHADYFGPVTNGNNPASDGFSALSKIQCAAFCSKSETCTSFSYKKDKKLCFHSSGLMHPAATGYPVFANKDHKIPDRSTALDERTTVIEPETTTSTITTEKSACSMRDDHERKTVGTNYRCLKKHTTPANYKDAAAKCLGEEGHLFTMRDHEDLNFVVYTYGLPTSWIDGGTNAKQWNGDPLPWTKWNLSYPKANECACLIKTPEKPMEMMTMNCTLFSPFVCQIDL